MHEAAGTSAEAIDVHFGGCPTHFGSKSFSISVLDSGTQCSCNERGEDSYFICELLAETIREVRRVTCQDGKLLG